MANRRRSTAAPLLERAFARLESVASHLMIGRDIETAYAATWWPVARAVLAIAAGYYLLLIPIVWHVERSGYAPVLSLIALLSAVLLIALFILTRTSSAVRLWQVELTQTTILLILLTNIYASQFLHLQMDRMINFIILPVAIAVIGATYRIIIPCLLVCLASLLYFSGQIGADAQAQFMTLVLTISIAAPLIHTVVRMIVLKEVRARKLAEKLRDSARRRADFDGLTGLPNRSQLFAELDSLLDRTKRPGLAVGVFDVDDFKAINDIYGNSLGDRLLVAVGQRLQQRCGDNCLLARLGGDEFAILQKGEFGLTAAQASFAEKQRALHDPFIIDGAQIRISVSVGVVVVGNETVPSQVISERGGFALYHAKRERGSLVVFSEELAVEMDNASAIRHALLNSDMVRELYLEFQPQVNIATGETFAFEALARWRNEKLGQISPNLFIPIAEREGIVDRLTLILLDKALTNAATWPHGIGLSFNLSARDLHSTNAVNDICRMVVASGISPSRIEFEVTETSVMTDFEQAKASLRRLIDLGCRIALDDFGAGYSNFVYIDELDITTLKLDRSFVARMRESHRAIKIVKTVLDLCNNLGIGCIVEGAERATDITLLKEIGAKTVQGYFFSPPMPAASVPHFLKAPRRA